MPLALRGIAWAHLIAIAARVMERHNIPVNDLHRTSKSFPPAPGDVHFTDEGSAKLARQVAECIPNALEEHGF